MTVESTGRIAAVVRAGYPDDGWMPDIDPPGDAPARASVHVAAIADASSPQSGIVDLGGVLYALGAPHPTRPFERYAFRVS